MLAAGYTPPPVYTPPMPLFFAAVIRFTLLHQPLRHAFYRPPRAEYEALRFSPQLSRQSRSRRG